MDEPINISIDAQHPSLDSEDQSVDLSLINIYELQKISLDEQLIFYAFSVASNGELKNAVINIDAEVDITEYQDQEIYISPILYNAGSLSNITIYGNVQLKYDQQNQVTLYKGVIFSNGSVDNCSSELQLQLQTSGSQDLIINNGTEDSFSVFQQPGQIIDQSQYQSTYIWIPNGDSTNEGKRQLNINSFINGSNNAFYKYYMVGAIKQFELYSLIQPMVLYYLCQDQIRITKPDSQDCTIIYASEERAYAFYDNIQYLCERQKLLSISQAISCVAASNCTGNNQIYQNLCLNSSITFELEQKQLSINGKKILFGYCPYYPRLSGITQQCNESAVQYDLEDNTITTITCSNNQQVYECVDYCGISYQLSAKQCQPKTSESDSKYKLIYYQSDKSSLDYVLSTLDEKQYEYYGENQIYKPCTQVIYDENMCQQNSSGQFQSYDWFYQQNGENNSGWYSCYNGYYASIQFDNFQGSFENLKQKLQNESSDYKNYQCKAECSNQYKYNISGFCLDCSEFESMPYVQDGSCTVQCTEDRFIELGTNVCVTECDDGQKYQILDDGKHCVEKCDNFSGFNKTISEVIEQCVDSCDELSGTYEYNKTCVQACPPEAQIIIEQKCKDDCPDDQFIKNPGFDSCIQNCNEQDSDYMYESDGKTYCLVCSENQYMKLNNGVYECTECTDDGWWLHGNNCTQENCNNEAQNIFEKDENGVNKCVSQCDEFVIETTVNTCVENCTDGFIIKDINQIQSKVCTDCTGMFKIPQQDGSYFCQNQCDEEHPFISDLSSNICLDKCSEQEEHKFYEEVDDTSIILKICMQECEIQQEIIQGIKDHQLCKECDDYEQQFIGYFQNKVLCIDKDKCKYVFNLTGTDGQQIQTCQGDKDDTNRNMTNCEYYKVYEQNNSYYECDMNCNKTMFVYENLCVENCDSYKFESEDRRQCLNECNPKLFIEENNGTLTCISKCDKSIINSTNPNVPHGYEECVSSCIGTDKEYEQDGICVSNCTGNKPFAQNKTCQEECDPGYIVNYFDNMTCVDCTQHYYINDSIEKCIFCEQGNPQYSSQDQNYSCTQDQPDSNEYVFDDKLQTDINCSQFISLPIVTQNHTNHSYQEDHKCVKNCSDDRRIIEATKECVTDCTSQYQFYNPHNKTCDTKCDQQYGYYKDETGTTYICQTNCTEFEYPSTYIQEDVNNNTRYCTDKCPDNMTYWDRNSKQCSDILCTYLNETIPDRKICEQQPGSEYCKVIQDDDQDGKYICKDNCTQPHYQSGYYCVINCTEPNKFHNNDSFTCTDTCASGLYVYNDSTTMFYCVDDCNSLQGSDGIPGLDRCVDNCTILVSEKLEQEGQCVEQCSDGYYNHNSVCITDCTVNTNYYIDYANQKRCIECDGSDDDQYIFEQDGNKFCLYCQDGQKLGYDNNNYQCLSSCDGYWQFTNFTDVDAGPDVFLCTQLECDIIISVLDKSFQIDDYYIQHITQNNTKQCLTNCTHGFLDGYNCSNTCTSTDSYFVDPQNGTKICINCDVVTEGIFQQVSSTTLKQCDFCNDTSEYAHDYQSSNAKECTDQNCKNTTDTPYTENKEGHSENYTWYYKYCVSTCPVFVTTDYFCDEQCGPDDEGFEIIDGQMICRHICPEYISEDPKLQQNSTNRCVESCTDHQSDFIFIEDKNCRNKCQTTEFYVTYTYQNGTQETVCEPTCDNYKYISDTEQQPYVYNCTVQCPEDKPYPDEDKFCQSQCALMLEEYQIITDPITEVTEQIVIRSCVSNCSYFIYQTQIDGQQTYVCVETCPNGQKFATIENNISSLPADQHYYLCQSTCTEGYYIAAEHDYNEGLIVQLCTDCDGNISDSSGAIGDIQQCAQDCTDIRPDLKFYYIAENGTKICVTQCAPSYTHIGSDGKCTSSCQTNEYEMVSSGVVLCLVDCPYWLKSYKPPRLNDDGTEQYQCVTICDGKVIGNICYDLGETEWPFGPGSGNGC